jgi:metal-sulfur cluster biosynthetic enzyme
MLTEHDICEALRACYATAPGHSQPLNIVDLGLIESIALTLDPDAPGANIPGVPPRHTVSITLVPTTPDENAQSILSMQIANCLAGLQQVASTSVLFAANPTWTPSRITPAGRRLLQLDFPILNNRIR